MKHIANSNCGSTKIFQEINPSFIKNANPYKIINDAMLQMPLYYYVLTTIDIDKNDCFIQTGSGPNLEGNYITLTTCKHYMRTFPKIDSGVWIAGITSKSLRNSGSNFLFYLALVEETFNNQYDIYTYLKGASFETCKVKLATKNRLGDIFESKKHLNDEGSKNIYKNYKEPLVNHSHHNSWKHDIYSGYKKPSRTIIFDPEYSFVWTKPIVELKSYISRGQRKINTLKEFLNMEKSK